MPSDRSLLIVIGTILALVETPVSAQDQAADDDWDYGEDVQKNTYVASVTYGSGQTLMAHCGDDRFSLAILGLPDQAGQPYSATAQIGSTSVQQTWKKMGGVAWLSTEPARDARALRRGGRPHRTPQGVRLADVEQEARQWNGKPVHPRHAQANEGRVAHISLPIEQVVAAR